MPLDLGCGTGGDSDTILISSRQRRSPGSICHYDTPLTPEHETEALLAAGFSSVEVLNRWEQTYTLKAVR